MSWYKTPEQVELDKQVADKRKRERELQKLLDDTDHKTFLDYEPKEGESVEQIKADRSNWRTEIREVQDWLETNAPAEEEV